MELIIYQPLNVILIFLLLWLYFRYLGPIFISFKKYYSWSQKPTKAYGKAACFDAYAAEDKVIPINQWREVSLGIAIAPLFHFYISFLKLTITPFGNIAYKIHTRSGWAIKKGLRNHLGIVDNDYRNELTAVVYNHGSYPVKIHKGDKISQIEFYRVPSIWMFQKKKLSKSLRGGRGFGSTGK